MALMNCPQCNHIISDKSKKCINCGCKIKRASMNKKTIITSFCIVIAILVLLFTISLITSKVSIKQYFSLISEKHFSCIVGNHNWKSATCDTPKYCSICNAKTGEPIEHVWKDADCINAKTCLYCKKTEGNSFGHTVNIGYCSRCHKHVNKYDVEFTVIKESISCMQKSYGKIKVYFNMGSSAIEELYYSRMAQSEALTIKEASCIAKDMCGDIQEFAKLKQCFASIDDALYGQFDTVLTLDNYVYYTNLLSEKIMNSIEAYNEAICEFNRMSGG